MCKKGGGRENGWVSVFREDEEKGKEGDRAGVRKEKKRGGGAEDSPERPLILPWMGEEGKKS